MYSINQKDINNYNYGVQKQNSFRQTPLNQTVKLPDYYVQNNEKKSFTDTMEEDPFFSIPYEMIIKPFVENPLTIIGTWLGFGAWLNIYNDACGGEYNNSLLKKITNVGDTLQESKIIQNKPVQATLSGLKSLKNGGSKVLQKSAILRAMKNTPSMPEWQMTKAQLFNQKQEVVQDFLKIVDALHLDSDGQYFDGFNEDRFLSSSRYEKNLVKQKFGTNISKGVSDSYILLKRLGKNEKEIDKILASDNVISSTKNEILKEMGLSKEKLKLIREDLYGKYIPDVEEASKKVSGRVKIGAGHYKFLGPLSKPFEREIACDEIYNKLYSMGDGARTSTGRFMSKFVQMFHRGLTFGGGKLGVLLFIAPILVEVAKNTEKAGKNEKVGTLANGLVESVSWVFTLPLALKLMHNLFGAQYAGMTKEQVQKCRNIRDAVNNKNAKCGYASKMEHDADITVAKQKIKELSKVEGQNFFTKGIRKLARFFTMDLERFDGYNSGNFASHQFHKMKNLPRNLVGIPMRFVTWGVLSMFVLGGLLTKATKAVFGESYDGMKQDEIKNDKKMQKRFTKDDLNERLLAMQTSKNTNKDQVKFNQTQNNINHRGKINQNNPVFGEVITSSKPEIQNNKIDNYTYIPSQENIIKPLQKQKRDNYTYIPSQNCTVKPKKENNPNKRTYIPSQEPANIQKTYDNSGIESVLQKADMAESKALKILAGNFDGMV